MPNLGRIKSKGGQYLLISCLRRLSFYFLFKCGTDPLSQFIEKRMLITIAKELCFPSHRVFHLFAIVSFSFILFSSAMTFFT